MKKYLLCMLAVCLLWCAAAPATLVLDQSQTEVTYGFAMGSGSTRWQEFTPTYDTIAQIDVLIQRGSEGAYGDIEIALTDNAGTTLWSDTIANASIPVLQNWISVTVDGPVSLVPGQVYKIEMDGVWDAWPQGEALAWMGKTESSYDRGVSDPAYAWDGYDYGFQTWAVPEPTTLLLVGLGAVILRRKRN